MMFLNVLISTYDQQEKSYAMIRGDIDLQNDYLVPTGAAEMLYSLLGGNQVDGLSQAQVFEGCMFS